jgi:hypothetical protein
MTKTLSDEQVFGSTPPPQTRWVEEAEVDAALVCAARTQALFEQYRAESLKSHAGEQFKDFVSALLKRAAEAGVWKDPS